MSTLSWTDFKSIYRQPFIPLIFHLVSFTLKVCQIFNILLSKNCYEKTNPFYLFKHGIMISNCLKNHKCVQNHHEFSALSRLLKPVAPAFGLSKAEEVRLGWADGKPAEALVALRTRVDRGRVKKI